MSHIIVEKQDSKTMENDTLLLDWLDNRFGTEQVSVMYRERKHCLVQKNNLVVRQVYLPDQRILRCDWSSPQHAGEKGLWFVTVERPSL